MAEEADDRCVRDQLKVLTGLKLPGFNWNANNMRMEFDIFWQTISAVRSKEEGKQRPLSPPGLKTWSACVSGRTIKRNKDT